MSCGRDNTRFLSCLIRTPGPPQPPYPWSWLRYKVGMSDFLIAFGVSTAVFIDWEYINGESNNSRGLPTKRTTSVLCHSPYSWGTGSRFGKKLGYRPQIVCKCYRNNQANLIFLPYASQNKLFMYISLYLLTHCAICGHFRNYFVFDW